MILATLLPSQSAEIKRNSASPYARVMNPITVIEPTPTPIASNASVSSGRASNRTRAVRHNPAACRPNSQPTNVTPPGLFTVPPPRDGFVGRVARSRWPRNEVPVG